MHVLHGVVWWVWLYVCDSHYVYVHMVEEKALGFEIYPTYVQENKGRSRDR